jgi:hypothetical protein
MKKKLNELNEYKGKDGYDQLRTQIEMLLNGYAKVTKLAPAMTDILKDN